jgi:hypothetical protein
MSDTCREKCQKLRHPSIASSPLKAECPVFSQLPWSQEERGFGSGGAPCLGVEATIYLKIVYFRRAEALSASAPSAVQSLPTLPAQPFRPDPPDPELLRQPSRSSSSPARAGCAPRNCPCSALAGPPTASRVAARTGERRRTTAELHTSRAPGVIER